MIFNLKEMREKADISQTELAARTGLTQAQVSRYEQNPDSIPMGTAVILLQALGQNFSSAAESMNGNYTKTEPLDAGEPYLGTKRNMDLLNHYLSQAPAGHEQHINERFQAENILETMRLATQRPRIAFMGNYDSGKSHMSNYLLGKELLPTDYSPTTKLAMMIQHIDMKPVGLTESVVILGRDEEGNPPDINMVGKLDYIKKHEMVRGTHHLLKEYGTHDSEQKLDGAILALVYDDSPLLKSCSITDSPGLLKDQHDQEIADYAIGGADLIIYASTFTGFMSSEDLATLPNIFDTLPEPASLAKNLKPLSNLLIVATHATPTINNEKLNKVLGKASKTLWQTHGETVLQRRQERFGVTFTEEDLGARFFTYWREIPTRCAGLRAAVLKALSEYIPAAINKGSAQKFKDIKEQADGHMIEKIREFEITKDNLSELTEKLKTMKEELPNKTKKLESLQQKVYSFTSNKRENASGTVSSIWSEVVDVEKVESLIRKKFDSDKDVAKKAAPQHVISLLQDKLSRSLDNDSQQLKPIIEEYLDEFRSASLESGVSSDGTGIPFNVEGAFLGGLAGLAGAGAMGLYAASLGNLGSYILIAKGVSILSALGISTGGVAATVTAISALGGPVTLAIGFAILAALAGFAFFGSWQKRLAKSIVSHLEEKNVQNRLLEAATKYWNDTDKAFKGCADNIEREYREHIDHLEELINSNISEEMIKESLQCLERTKAFFANMPWMTEGDKILL